MWLALSDYHDDPFRSEKIAELRCNFLGLKDQKEALVKEGLVTKYLEYFEKEENPNICRELISSIQSLVYDSEHASMELKEAAETDSFMEKLLRVLTHEDVQPKSIDFVLSFLIFLLRRELANRDDLIRVDFLSPLKEVLNTERRKKSVFQLISALSINSYYRRKVAENTAIVEALIHSVCSTECAMEIKFHAIAALSNLSLNELDFCLYLGKQKQFMRALERLRIYPPSALLRLKLSKLIGNIASFIKIENAKSSLRGAIEVTIVHIQNSEQIETVKEACRALGVLSSLGEGYVRHAIECKVFQHLSKAISLEILKLPQDWNTSLVQALLQCTASLLGYSDFARRVYVTGTHPAGLVKIFEEPSNMAIFEAAIECVLSLSRTKESFCMIFESENVIKKLVEMWPISTINSVCNALSLLSNIAMFARKKILKNETAIDNIKASTQSKNDLLRLKSLTCVKNLLYLASNEETKEILAKFPIEKLLTFLNDEQNGIQEQALAAFRSITLVEGTFENKSELKQQLVNTIAQKFTGGPLFPDIMNQCLFVLNNLAYTSQEFRDELVYDGRLIPHILKSLEHGNTHVKLGGLFCVKTLSEKNEKENEGQINKRKITLKNMGIVNYLKNARTAADALVEQSVMNLLEIFSHKIEL